jgi:hypothetical protein
MNGVTAKSQVEGTYPGGQVTPVESGTMAPFASAVVPAGKLTVDTTGVVPPAGKTVNRPVFVGATAVTLTLTAATPEDGTPQFPWTGKTLGSSAAGLPVDVRYGPYWPTVVPVFRVSTIRHGVREWNWNGPSPRPGAADTTSPAPTRRATTRCLLVISTPRFAANPTTGSYADPARSIA